MKVYGNAMAGGPLTVRGIPVPTDPTLHYVRPTPPPSPTVVKAPKPRTYSRKPGVRTPADVREAIVRDWLEGDSARAIAERHGVHRQTVYVICKEAS